jgi:molybdopterin converting factor small subunit
MNGSPGKVTVVVQYLGHLRQHMGGSVEELTLEPPVTVRSLLDHLVGIHGPAVADLFFNQYGWLDPRLFFLVDEDGMTYREHHLERELTGGERITMFLGMPMAGG